MEPTAVDHETSVARLQTRIDYLEENRRYIQNSLEMALWLSDFHAHLVKDNDHDLLLQEAVERFEKIIPMQACAIYLVDAETAEFKLALCQPRSLCDLAGIGVELVAHPRHEPHLHGLALIDDSEPFAEHSTVDSGDGSCLII